MVPRPLVALRNLAAHLHLRGRGDVAAETSDEGIVEDVAQEAVEITGAAAAEKGHVRRDLARAAVVAGVGYAEAVGRGLALGSGEGRRAQTAGAEVGRHAGATVSAAETPTRARVVFARGAGEALQEQEMEGGGGS